jgi:putative membrane protein
MQRTKRIIGIVVLLLVALLVLAFSMRNNVAVSIDYFAGTVELPLAVALASTLVVGALIGVLATSGWVWRARREARVLRRENATRRKEIDNLRSAPLKDQG